ncbi:Mobile element protein [hydrothermal vent metagenome]|uniref:Mobile element protein n=1 Tax=hydrothermal vent metagenome TaxID=652676 RepID=A0A1W1E587_9ZZZZ
MARPRKLTQSFQQEDFKLLAQNETNSKTKIRFMALNNIQKGQTYASTATTFLITIDSVNKWMARYNKNGIEGLRNKPMSGRTSLANDKDKSKIFDKIIELQSSKKGGRVRLKDIDKLLKDDFNINYKNLSGVHKLVTRLGISWISARSKHPNQDLEKQTLYKKLQNQGDRCTT